MLSANPAPTDASEAGIKYVFSWRDFIFCCLKSDIEPNPVADFKEKEPLPKKIEAREPVSYPAGKCSTRFNQIPIGKPETASDKQCSMEEVEKNREDAPARDEDVQDVHEGGQLKDPEVSDAEHEAQPDGASTLDRDEDENSPHLVGMESDKAGFSEDLLAPTDDCSAMPNEETNANPDEEEVPQVEISTKQDQEESRDEMPTSANIGDLRMKIVFNSEKKCLLITIMEAHDFARPPSSTMSIKDVATLDVPAVLAYSVHVLVVQMKKLRFKTKMKQGPDPFFDEVIKIAKFQKEEGIKWCLRFRLYGSMRNSIQQIIGEGFLQLQKLDLDTTNQCKLALISHDVVSCEEEMDTLISTSEGNIDSHLSLESITGVFNYLESGVTPVLQVDLAYNFTSGELSIEIKRGSMFPKLKGNKAPDSFVRILILDVKDKEMFKSKTSVKKSSCEPLFEETFNFQISKSQIEEVTLKIQGYQKLKLGKKCLFGTISLGRKYTDEETMKHWNNLLAAKSGTQISRWHSFDAKGK